MFVEQWLGKDNQLGIDIWQKKYRHDNETFDEWLDRVSGGNQDIRELIKEKKFLFGGRILANRGLQKYGKKITYSNCYVIAPPEDNIESIYDTASRLARTFSYGGGCGIDISKLAPKGAKVNNAAKETSGAVSFMDTYSHVTEQIGQNGRRGALMISMDCHHPDIEDFIDIKTDLNKVTKANISIRFTDDFMKAVENNELFELKFNRKETGEVITKTVNARDVFMKLAKNNWDFAEPGCLFWDRISDYNLLANTDEFEYAGTNPCAEEPLPAGGSCLLGSINLSEFVYDDYFHWNELRDTVEKAVVALNEVLDEGLSLHPLQEQRDSVRDWRQIGLGVMGIADMLIKLGIRYGSAESIDVCNMIGHEIATAAIMQSYNLAKQYGKFPRCNMEEVGSTNFFMNHLPKDGDFDDVELYNQMMKDGLRNSQLLTIAPTGTLSTMIGVSGGIEPIFANYYTRKTVSLNDEETYYKVYTPIVQEYMDQYGLTDESQLPDYFVTAATIPYNERINMQAVWQQHIDASISSTVNVPNDFTVDKVFDLYMYAWKSGLKGVTIYRDGCQRSGILTTDNTPNTTEEKKEEALPRGTIINCSSDLVGKKRKLQTGCGSLHVLAFFDPANGELQEVYFNKGSTGGCANFMTGLSRMVSLLCRAGVDVYTIKDQLDSCGVCPSYATRSATKHDTSKGSCCPMAIGNALINMYEEMQSDLFDEDEIYVTEEKYEKYVKDTQIIKDVRDGLTSTCPECGGELSYEGGCIQCHNCGYSKCG